MFIGIEKLFKVKSLFMNHKHRAFAKSNLNNLQEYIVGSTARYFIYSIGYTEEKDVLGISTLANWT